jgi:hypothetical protein
MITPVLNLNFTTAVLDPRITFARSGATATRINSGGYIETVAADTPRFDFNPVTLACSGLLIEESRSNISLLSENFSGWTPQPGVTITSSQPGSPANTSTAALLTKTGASTFQSINRSSTVANATAYVASIFIKNVDAAQTRYRVISNTADVSLFVDWSNPSANGVNYGNGWYRFSIAFTSATTSANVFIYPASSGTATGSILVWGTQLEAGTFATSYIPTTTTALTRNADVATMTGTNFSDWWQASKGGAQVQAIQSTVSGIRPLVQYDDGTADNIIALRGNATNPELQIVDGGVSQVQLDVGTIVANTPYSLTGWWATNDCKARKDSGAVVTDTTATIPTVTQARLGSDGTNYLNGHLVTVNYYDSFFGQSIYTRRKNKVIFSLL